MAGNGFPRAGRSGRTPHFLTVGLLVVICILAFNYWNVSSQNKILQKERSEMTRHLEELALKRVHLEKRSEALDQQLKTNNMEVQALTNDKNSCQENLRDTGDERDQFKTKYYECESELRELKMQVEDSNATVDRQKGELQALQQQLDNRQGEMYRLENLLKETDEKLAAVSGENARLTQQLINIQQQQQQQPQQPPLIPGVPQIEKNIPPAYQQSQQALPGGIQQQQQLQQQQYHGHENIPPLSNKFIVPNLNLKIPEVPNVYQRIEDYQPKNVPVYDPNAIPKAGDALVVPNFQVPQENEMRDETNVGARIEDNPQNGNVLLEQDQQMDRPVDGDMNQDALNKDPGMVGHIGDEGEEKGDDIEIVGEEGKENDVDLNDVDNGVMDQKSDGVEDQDSDMESESQGGQALEHREGGIEDGQNSAQDDEEDILFRGGVQDDGDEDSQSESDYDFNKGDADDEKDEDLRDEDQDDINQDNKLRFEPNQEGNHLNPGPAY